VTILTQLAANWLEMSKIERMWQIELLSSELHHFIGTRRNPSHRSIEACQIETSEAFFQRQTTFLR
jgi:hypothetical protein